MKEFSLLVKPTSADCNLRCHYCFYLGKCTLYPEPARHRMSDTVLEAMIRSFMATPQSQYAFGWQGGEPTLMGVEFFRRVTALQEKHGRTGAVVANGLQTNGTLLTDEFAEHLAKYQFLVGVSLDGPPEIHDAHRHYVDGRGSHADVLRGIACLERRKVDFNILVLVNEANVKRPRDVYRYLCDRNFLYQQYIECVEFDEAGRLLPFAVTGEAWGDFHCELFDEWIRHDTRRVSIRMFDSILAMLVDNVANVCKMGLDCRQYFVVEHNGDIYPCDFFVEKDLRLGHVQEVNWEKVLKSPAYADFGRRKTCWNAACEECEYVKFCAGDCPKNRFGARGDSQTLSALCTGWKQFYRHALPGLQRLADEIRAERARTRPAPVPASNAGTVRQAPGRNDPCLCGSGKKFKKCCGAAG